MKRPAWLRMRRTGTRDSGLRNSPGTMKQDRSSPRVTLFERDTSTKSFCLPPQCARGNSERENRNRPVGSKMGSLRIAVPPHCLRAFLDASRSVCPAVCPADGTQEPAVAAHRVWNCGRKGVRVTWQRFLHQPAAAPFAGSCPKGAVAGRTERSFRRTAFVHSAAIPGSVSLMRRLGKSTSRPGETSSPLPGPNRRRSARRVPRNYPCPPSRTEKSGSSRGRHCHCPLVP
jgi:hypothetical protein